MSDADTTVHLLLARADDHLPVLPDGAQISAALAPMRAEAWRGPSPPPDPPPISPSEPGAGDEPDDAPQPPPPPLWGLIVPEGARGDRLLTLVAPLIEAREAKQGRPAPVYRVPASKGAMGITEAVRWRKKAYDDGADLGTRRAEYQLILGDLSEVPLAIQQVQAIDGYVGRLFFADERGYAAYVDKLLRAEGATPRGPGRVVMHVAHDGSPAIDLGDRGLFAPGEALLRDGIAAGTCAASGVVAYSAPGKPGLDTLLDHAAGPDPGVLLTLSHGQGPPMEGWHSPEDQRAGQGAMVFGVTGLLTGADLAARPFMPSGLWLMFACFGAGTPDSSAFSPWMQQLTAPGRRPPDLARSLAMGAPFVADLPQKVLANPDGPLAFISHVDLAWTYSFLEAGSPDAHRPGRFFRVLARALDADTVGAAFQELTRFVVEIDTNLTGLYAEGAARDAGPATASPSPEDEAIERAKIWMTRQDLAGFILLGDPMARLPVRPGGASEGLRDATPDTTAPPPTAITADRIEQAVGQVLAGGRKVEEIATEFGIDPQELAKYVAAYVQAGRAALGIRS